MMSARPDFAGIASAALRAGLDVTRFITFISGQERRTPACDRNVDVHGPAATTNARARMSNVLFVNTSRAFIPVIVRPDISAPAAST